MAFFLIYFPFFFGGGLSCLFSSCNETIIYLQYLNTELVQVLNTKVSLEVTAAAGRCMQSLLSINRVLDYYLNADK